MERRTIAELIFLYEHEHSFRDIYVEGPTDRAFVAGVLRRTGIVDVAVREIDVIDVPAEQLTELQFTSGNRQRVIALAIVLERRTKVNLASRVICIADADAENEAARSRSALLLYTDVNSMPVYSFQEPYIQWYLDVQLLGFPKTAEQIIDSLVPILKQVAVVRRAMIKLGVSASPPSIEADCQVDGSAITFYLDRFVTRCLNKAGRADLLEAIHVETTSHDWLLPQDFQTWVNADDFLDLLHWLIVRHRRNSNTVPRNLLGRTLLLGIPISDAATWPLFGAVFSRLAPGNRQPGASNEVEPQQHERAKSDRTRRG